MLNPFNNPTVSTLEQVVQFAQARHGVLAGNIANLNTPDYKSRDLSPEKFQESLKEALEASRRPPSTSDSSGLGTLIGEAPRLLTSSQRQGFGEIDPEALAGVKESMTEVVYHDGRDVSLEYQVTELTKNQSMHNLAVSLMAAQFRLLQAAISENVTNA